jgi:hypothetical protein
MSSGYQDRKENAAARDRDSHVGSDIGNFYKDSFRELVENSSKKPLHVCIVGQQRSFLPGAKRPGLQGEIRRDGFTPVVTGIFRSPL